MAAPPFTGEPANGLGVLATESGIAQQVKAALARRGFEIIPPGNQFGTDEFGGYRAIQWDSKHRVF